MTFPLILNICVEEEMKPKLSEEAILDWTKNLKMGAGKSITYQVKFVVDSNSWVQPEHANSANRIFFSTKVMIMKLCILAQ